MNPPRVVSREGGESRPAEERRKPTEFCIDYGHHGRERCVFCGIERGAA